MFGYWYIQMVYAEILVFQNRVISKNVYEIVFVCPPFTARKSLDSSPEKNDLNGRSTYA